MPTKVAPEVLEKTALEVKFYNFDFSGELESGDTISTAQASVAPATGAPTLSNPEIQGTIVQTKISLGSVGRYLIGMRITTNNGETLDAFGHLNITAN